MYAAEPPIDAANGDSVEVTGDDRASCRCRAHGSVGELDKRRRRAREPVGA
jgi:hypothetical protein